MILITGSTGQLGSMVAKNLRGRAPIRLLVRDPGRAPALDADLVVADYADPDSLIMAFRGVEQAFIVSSMGEPMKRALLHRNAFEAAARSGVSHIVYTSFQSASPDSAFPYGVDHYQSEQYLKDTGVAFSVLRDSLYAEMVPELADENGSIRGPAGSGKVAWVSRQDVADVAADLLLKHPRESAIYTMTGPEALDLHRTAQILSEATGKPSRYVDETLDEARSWRSEYSVPDWELDVWIGSYLSIRTASWHPFPAMSNGFWEGRHGRWKIP